MMASSLTACNYQNPPVCCFLAKFKEERKHEEDLVVVVK